LINVSMNELSSLLKRSFEGLGYCQADYEDAAAAVVWLEAHGLKGLETIASIPERAVRLDTSIDISTDESESLVLDAQGGNVVFCGRMAVDLACAKATSEGSGRVELRECHGREAILPSLPLCSARGLNAVACWSDKNGLTVSSIKAPQRAPELRCLRRGANDKTEDTALVVVCSKDPEEIDAIASKFIGTDCETRTSAKIASGDMLKCYDQTIRNGLLVDMSFVRRLMTAAEAVLVEASERSRLGAGESPS
jgi:hypothetical protein